MQRVSFFFLDTVFLSIVVAVRCLFQPRLYCVLKYLYYSPLDFQGNCLMCFELSFIVNSGWTEALKEEVEMFRADSSGTATFSMVAWPLLISCLISLCCISPSVAEKLKHVKLLLGSIKTQEGRAVKGLFRGFLGERSPLSGWLANGQAVKV